MLGTERPAAPLCFPPFDRPSAIWKTVPTGLGYLPSHFPKPHLRTWKAGQGREPNRIVGRVMMIPCGLNPAIWRQGGRIPCRHNLDRKGNELPKATVGHKHPNWHTSRHPSKQEEARPSSSSPPHRHLLQPLCAILHSLSDLSGNSINNPCCISTRHSRTSPGKEEFFGSIQDLVCTSPAHLARTSCLHLAAPRLYPTSSKLPANYGNTANRTSACCELSRVPEYPNKPSFRD